MNKGNCTLYQSGRPPLHRSTELTTKSPPCEGGERGVVISSSCLSLLNLYVFPHATLFVLLAAAAGTGAVSSDLWRLLCGWFQKLFGFIFILTLHFFFSFCFPPFLPFFNMLFIIKRQPVAGIKSNMFTIRRENPFDIFLIECNTWEWLFFSESSFFLAKGEKGFFIFATHKIKQCVSRLYSKIHIFM